MQINRIFNSEYYFQPRDAEPIRSVVTETQHAVVVAWCLKPGQMISAHIHPLGQDTWTVLSGRGMYYLDQYNTTQAIVAHDVVVAPQGLCTWCMERWY